MSGFVRKFGKAKTFSNLVVQLTKIFFCNCYFKRSPSACTLMNVHYKQAGTICASFALLLY